MAYIGTTTYVIDSRASGQSLHVGFEVKEKSTSTTGNTSTLEFVWEAKQGITWSGSSRASGAELELKINGSIVASKTIPLNQNSGAGTSWNGYGTTTVAHNSDGKKSVSIEINIKKGRGYNNGYHQDQDPFVYAAKSESGTLVLTALDRAAPKITTTRTNWTNSNTASVGLSVDTRCDMWQYRVKKSGGSYGKWSNIPVSDYVNARSCDFEIHGLDPACNYYIQFKVRRWVNGIETTVEKTFKTANPTGPGVGDIRLTYRTHNELTVECFGFTPTPPARESHYDFSRNLGWIDNGLSTQYTFIGLTPDTDYQISASLVDNYGTRSGSATRIFRTHKPPAPNVQDVDVVAVDPFTVNVFPGYTSVAEGYSELDHYEINFNNGRGWINGGKSSFSVKSLEPDTTYSVSFRAVDNYGTYSNTVYATVATPPDHFDAVLKKDGFWGMHKLSRNVDGNMRKVKNLWRKRNGTWKKCK